MKNCNIWPVLSNSGSCLNLSDPAAFFRLTLPVADGIYAGTIYKMSDQWLSVYPYDKSQENDGSIQPVALSAQDASYYTIDGDEVGHGHIPETTATPDSPIQAGAYNAIIVIKDKKVKEVFVNETGFWK